MKNKNRLFFVIIMIFPFIMISAKNTKYNSYKGLIMAGYQGWFNAPDDGAGRGWYHYSGPKGRFEPGCCTIDMWPDVREYKKVYKTKFVFDDGTPAYTFSSHDPSTVDTHFRWMKEYGLSGVFMQRFVNEVKGKSGKMHFNKVLASAVSSARKYDRAICIMYDLSGMKKTDVDFILSDLDELDSTYKFKKRKKVPTYLFHNKKPLVAVWGVGFPGRSYDVEDAAKLVKEIRKRGYSVMLGTPARWLPKEGKTPSASQVELLDLIKECDIVMPWFVGWYNDKVYLNMQPIIAEHLDWCNKNGVDYAPLAFPGFSWKNMYGPNTTQIPRNKGDFFWAQLSGAISMGAEMLYIAMFDEIDEGTAIFKCATRVPESFVPIEEGLQSDHYLWLVGEAGKMLRKEIPLSIFQPVRK
ncbi:glycoside hydrolase family 71/99-like protein [uncultured Coprobacter sp.]|uniref:glycoside hydrolase family 71/99-like protein n=1 Tax=uncultured Coprobacter sp. TaxID=1720550 RepID=UPI002598AC44|nr:glycoside hydrolase family 71/99-like protein [uncultured Coprobacter sp.]